MSWKNDPYRDYDGEGGETFSPWETYSDLYCGLLLVFVLLFFFAIYQYIAAKETNAADTAALQQSMIEEQEAVLALYKADLEDQEEAYAEKDAELSSRQAALAVVQADLKDRESEIASKDAALSIKETELAEKTSLLEEQSLQLADMQKLIDAQADQIEQIVGVRGAMIEALNEELVANGISVQADRSTGAIAVESTILFELDSDRLSSEGEAFFKRFMPVYIRALLESGYRDYVAEIMIEGHSDQQGTYLHNLELSQRRALSVASYILDSGNGCLSEREADMLRELVTVNGCADRDLVHREDGTADAEKSRRVEIKFRLRDEEMIEELDALLNPQESGR